MERDVAPDETGNDWETRYANLLELGRELTPLASDERTDDHRVRGCASHCWIVTGIGSGNYGEATVTFRGDSDSVIVRGLIAVLQREISDLPARKILSIDVKGLFRALGLEGHLTPQRSNGFASIVERVRAEARRALTG